MQIFGGSPLFQATYDMRIEKTTTINSLSLCQMLGGLRKEKCSLYLYYNAFCCIVLLHCIRLHCVVLYCMVLSVAPRRCLLHYLVSSFLV